MPNDYDYVNFSEDYELDRHLKELNKSESLKNRNILRELGEKLKKTLSRDMITHSEFKNYIEKNLRLLDDPMIAIAEFKFKEK